MACPLQAAVGRRLETNNRGLAHNERDDERHPVPATARILSAVGRAAADRLG